MGEAHPTEKEEGIYTDFIVVLDANGRELERVSIMRAIENSTYTALRVGVDDGFERFHTNTIEWLDGSLADKVPAFEKGNVLISLHRQDRDRGRRYGRRESRLGGVGYVAEAA